MCRFNIGVVCAQGQSLGLAQGLLKFCGEFFHTHSGSPMCLTARVQRLLFKGAPYAIKSNVMNIHQLSIIYVEEQDRILVRFNTSEGEELRLWLTRRMLARVFEPLQDAVGHLEARKTPLTDGSASSRRMLADLKRAEVLEKSDFSTPYKSQSSDFPLGTQPLVVTQMSMSVQDSRQLQISFEERLAQHEAARSFQVSMESPMLHGFMHLLESALGKAQWDLAGVLHHGTETNAEETGEPARPKYLQ
jgi:hypothetical protein